jgi:hypothetical protein
MGDTHHAFAPSVELAFKRRAQNAIAKLESALSESDMSKGLTLMVHDTANRAPLANSPLHGWRHWMSVYRNAAVIAELGNYHAQFLEIDFTLVAMLFALFHDCQRHSEGPDNTHGAYGAAALDSYLRGCPRRREFDAAKLACSLHTVVDFPRRCPAFGMIHPMLTGFNRHRDESEFVRAVGMCLDADRLDLQRPGLGMDVDERFLNDPPTAFRAMKFLNSAGAWNE